MFQNNPHLMMLPAPPDDGEFLVLNAAQIGNLGTVLSGGCGGPSVLSAKTKCPKSLRQVGAALLGLIAMLIGSSSVATGMQLPTKFGSPRPEVVAERCMVGFERGQVDEAAVYQKRFSATNERLINQFFIDRNWPFFRRSVGKNDPLPDSSRALKAFDTMILNRWFGFDVIPLFSEDECFNCGIISKSWCSSRILIENDDVKRFINFEQTVWFSKDAAYLSAMGGTCNFYLVDGSSCKFFISFNQLMGLFAGRFHFGKLFIQNTISQPTHEDSGEAEPSNRDGGIGRFPHSTVLAIFILILSMAIMKLAFYVGDAPDNPIFVRLLSWSIGLVAVILIGQGISLLLTGNWLISIGR